MTMLHPTPTGIWQGRDDSAESPDALRVFQTVSFTPQAGKVALIGFESDEGVRRNQGRTGAAAAPDILRKALANMASHAGHRQLVDIGNLRAGSDLEAAQQALHDTVLACQRQRMRTLVFGGGHDTAFGHGSGVLDAFPGESVAILNLDAHLDLREAAQATSGTPFRQLALHCASQQRAFHYTCIGASEAANTAALWAEAARRNVTVIDDITALTQFQTVVMAEMTRLIASHQRIYLTIDLDVLPVAEMPAVSAPAALGIPLIMLLQIIAPLCESGKLQAVDLVELNPQFDRDGQGARTAARLAWQILHGWQHPDAQAQT